MLKRQIVVCAAFVVLLVVFVAGLYLHNRQHEWLLRSREVTHRLDGAFELITREVDRVRSDVLFLANLISVREFAAGDEQIRTDLELDFSQFLKRRNKYDQIRILSPAGKETIRVNLSKDGPVAVKRALLQDKSDRYYFRESQQLKENEVFVSEFDLNLEHGKIERPKKPVIRFIAPITLDDESNGFLVLNYLGSSLLQDLDNDSIPGISMLLRSDGHYVHGPNPNDEFGWVLGHENSFKTQYPREWMQIRNMTNCRWTSRGAFMSRLISLGKTPRIKTDSSFSNSNSSESFPPNSLIVVSHLPRDQVFLGSDSLLKRLLLLGFALLVPVAIITHYWTQANWMRNQQAQKILQSQEQLRNLSSRLLRAHEDERRAISREIHDEFGQQVTAISLDLKLADRNMDSQNQASSHIHRAIGETGTLLSSLQNFATRLRPAVLDDLGLPKAVESHVSEFSNRTAIDVRLEIELGDKLIPATIADNAYRLLQESLNNVVKHAGASTVTVNIGVDDHAVLPFFLSVQDNGNGCEPQDNGHGLGLIGMQERVDLLHGEFSMESSEDGTAIRVRLPICQ